MEFLLLEASKKRIFVHQGFFFTVSLFLIDLPIENNSDLWFSAIHFYGVILRIQGFK